MKRETIPDPIVNIHGFTVKEVMDALQQYKPDDLVFAASAFSASITNAISVYSVVGGLCISTTLPHGYDKGDVSDEAQDAARKAGLQADKADVFGYGFDAGQERALSHQWVSVEDALPEDDEDVVLVYAYDSYSGSPYFDLATLDGEWYSTSGAAIEVIKWLPIPQLNPEKE